VGEQIKLLLDRSEYGDDSTVGDLYIAGVWESATLEDSLAVNGVKVEGKTCIPDGMYEVLITWSPKFKRRLPLLIDVPGFDGIRIHPGNTAEDTAGCLLVGEKVIHVADVPFLTHSREAFDRLFAKIDAAYTTGEKLFIEVRA
jgi:hypothetical protein